MKIWFPIIFVLFTTAYIILFSFVVIPKIQELQNQTITSHSPEYYGNFSVTPSSNDDGSPIIGFTAGLVGGQAMGASVGLITGGSQGMVAGIIGGTMGGQP
jgi:tetrahydromethanopterin S-methyltransferase subunit D